MAQFIVDPDKCNRDYICESECPLHIIKLTDESPTPTLIENGEDMCINCGHCVAACPSGAISLSSMLVEECTSTEDMHLPSAEQFANLVRSRRSTRVYKNKPVEKEKLERILDTVRYAPTGKNTQLIRWVVISSREKFENLASLCIDWMRDQIDKQTPMAAAFDMPRMVSSWDKGYDYILRKAPGLVIAYAPRAYPGGVIDSTIALTTFELTALTEGLSTCWAGYLMIAAGQWLPLQNALDLPEDNMLTGAMMVGYPKRSYKRIPLRNEAKIMWR